MDITFLAEVAATLQDNAWARIGVIVVFLVVAHYVIKVMSGVVLRGLIRGKKYQSKRAEEQREKTLTMVFNRTSAVVLWIIGIFFALSQLDFNWSGLLAGAGLIGIVVGFGAQKIAGDFFAGIFILLENQYGIGDVIEIKDMAYGEVERIDLRTTHIRNLDGGLHIIANGDIVNMTNHSYGWSAALIYMWFDYKSDVDTIEKLMNKVGAELSKDETWAKELHSPIVFDRVEDYGADGLKVRAMGETAPGMQWAIAGEFRRRLKPELDKAGVAVAYPHRIIKQA